MMVGMGLNLTLVNFRAILEQPVSVLSGLVCQILGLPILGLLVIWVFSISANDALGLMILTACAGGVVSGLITQAAGGNVALSVSLTSVSMLVGIISTPFMIGSAMRCFIDAQSFVELDMMGMSIQLLCLTVLPVVAGMLLRQWQPSFAVKIQPTVARASNLMLLTVVLYQIYAEQIFHLFMLDQFRVLVAALCLLNLLALLLGYVSAWSAGYSTTTKLTMAIEVGIQNSATGIFIATVLLQRPELSIPSLIYTAIAFLSAAIIVLLARITGMSRELVTL